MRVPLVFLSCASGPGHNPWLQFGRFASSGFSCSRPSRPRPKRGPRLPAASAPAAPSVVETADPVPAADRFCWVPRNGLPVFGGIPGGCFACRSLLTYRFEGSSRFLTGSQPLSLLSFIPGPALLPFRLRTFLGLLPRRRRFPLLPLPLREGISPFSLAPRSCTLFSVSSAEAGSGHYELVLSSEAAEGPAGQALPFEVGIRMSGDFQLPDRESAIVTFDMGALSMRMEMVSVDGDVYIKDPLSGEWSPGSPGLETGPWRVAGGASLRSAGGRRSSRFGAAGVQGHPGREARLPPLGGGRDRPSCRYVPGGCAPGWVGVGVLLGGYGGLPGPPGAA